MFANNISTIDHSKIVSLRLLKLIAKNTHKALEKKHAEIEKVELEKRCWSNLELLNRLKKRAEYLEAFLISVYQQEYKVKEILETSKLDVFSEIWEPSKFCVCLTPKKKIRATSPVWLPKGLSQPRLRRFNGIGQLVS